MAMENSWESSQNGIISLDYDRFPNSVSMNRAMSALRNLWVIQNKGGPSMISLGTGTPNPQCFPFQCITVKTKNGRSWELKGAELDVALGYTDSRGNAQLREWLGVLQKRLHDPPYARDNPELNELTIIPGSEDGQCKILEMILVPGDPVLIAEPTYPGVLSALRPMKVQFLLVETDENGAKPESLEKILLEYHDGSKRNKIKPKILIIQPNHCNPIGISTSLERKKEIYKLACKYDILILEDDPYYFLTFGRVSSLPTSFLSLDTEGRVLRLDSFSKIVSPGFRIGTLSGPKALVEKVTMHVACSSLHASTFTQTLLYGFLEDCGLDGFMKHTRSVAEFYERRCEIMLKSAKRHLSGLAEWNGPSGGMFVWIKLPMIKDTEEMLMKKGLEKMVMLAPGCYFMCDDTKPTKYVRASFSWASEEEMEEGMKRLAEMIREEMISEK